MKRRKNLLPLALLTILSLVLVIVLVVKFPPDSKVKVMGYELGVMSLFFLLTFFATFGFSTLLFNNARRGVLVGLGITIFLLLRLLGLTSIFYVLILLSTLVAIEFAFRRN